jgi:hypothetical protein
MNHRICLSLMGFVLSLATCTPVVKGYRVLRSKSYKACQEMAEALEAPEEAGA